MFCTQCGEKTNRITSAYKKNGTWIVKKDEKLCGKCICLRGEARSLRQIHDGGEYGRLV